MLTPEELTAFRDAAYEAIGNREVMEYLASCRRQGLVGGGG